ncbi:MAG: TonB-dependent receptor [Lutibacter sp.]|nr:MAG: TonB-dependent receptor [Lutibacter sp.]
MKKITQFLLVTLFIATSTMYGQTLTGTVMDDSNQPLPGADVILDGTTKGASTDFSGNFSIDVPAGNGTVTVSFIGYSNKNIAFTVAEGQTVNLGTIELAASQEALDEIVIVGSGVVDLANSRRTPIATSTIPVAEIQAKIGTADITQTLVNTPSVYVAGQNGGYGDSRISVRGFDQTNTAFLLNGQPINGMEDGKMYWSNWSGLSDIASVVQMQRGLGASKLAISSVGGTVNFVMNATAQKEGGNFSVGMANDGYLKTTASYSTGISEKGWGTTVLLSHWQGNGYNDGNFGKGQTYFISFGYKASERSNFNFLITGAPQYHDQNFSKSISTYLERGRKYNSNWGTYKGQYMTERRNFYHKPVMNLNWDFDINETTSLSTVLYASIGRGGGTGNRVQSNNRLDLTADGQVDYDGYYALNAATSGAGGYFAADGGYITRASMNLHSWYGTVSNFKKQLNDNLTLNVGMDLRTYYGKHFRIVENFHGLTSWQENIRLRDPNNNHQTFGSFGTYKNVITTRDMAANPWTALFSSFDDEEKIAYNSEERISYGGLFTQLEYANDKMSAFFQGSVNNQWSQRFDLYQYADASLVDGTSSQATGALPSGIEAGTDSEKISNFGYNLKAGASYTIDDENVVYGNAGYYDRQPYFDNIFSSFNNLANDFATNEKILGLELGYAFKGENISANLDLYRTSWKDRVTSSTRVVSGVVQNTLNFGVEQLHTGIELALKAKATDQLKFTGFLSIGNWEYKGTATRLVQDEDQNFISETLEDVDGGKVGDAAQFTAGVGTRYEIVENLSVDVDYRFYNNLYANVGAVKENLEIPSYGVADMGVSFKFPLEEGKSLSLRANVNNVLNNIYIAELRTANTADVGDETYNGLNVSNQGYFGKGRTWNFTARYKF